TPSRAPANGPTAHPLSPRTRSHRVPPLSPRTRASGAPVLPAHTVSPRHRPEQLWLANARPDEPARPRTPAPPRSSPCPGRDHPPQTFAAPVPPPAHAAHPAYQRPHDPVTHSLLALGASSSPRALTGTSRTRFRADALPPPASDTRPHRPLRACALVP